MTQEAAYILNIKGSTDTISSLNAVQKNIAEVSAELAALKKEGAAAEKEIKKLTEAKAKLTAQEQNIKKELGEVNKRMKELLSTNKQASKEYKELKTRRQELLTLEGKVDKQLQSTTAKLDQQNKVVQRATTDINLLTTRKNAYRVVSNELGKEARKEATAFNDLNKQFTQQLGYIPRLEKEHRRLREEIRKQVDITTQHSQALIRQANIVKNQLDSANRSFGDYKSTIGDYDGALRRTGAGLLSFGKQALGAFGVGSALYLGADIMRKGATAALEFEQGLSRLRAITGATDEQMTLLAANALEISELFGTAANEILKTAQLVANAFPELLQNTDLLLKVTRDAEILAQGGLIEIQDSVDLLAVTMNAFNLSGEQSGIVIDVLADAAIKGTVPIEVMAKELKDVALTARQSGLSLEETVAATQAMGKAGVPFAKIGVGLRNILVALAKTGRDDLNPAMVDFATILKTLDGEIKTAGDAIRFFKAENLNASLGLISQKDLFAEMTEGLGQYSSAMTLATENTDNTLGSIQKMQTALDNLFIEGEQKSSLFAKGVRSVIDDLTVMFKVMADNDGSAEGFFKTLQEGFKNLTVAGQVAKTIEKAFFAGDGTVDIDKAKESMAEFLHESQLLLKVQDEQANKQEIVNATLTKYNNLSEKSTKELRALKIELESQPLDGANRKRVLDQLTLIQQEIDKRKELTEGIEIFAKDSVGFLEQQIEKLNKTLKNTTDETVIEKTVKQIETLKRSLEDLKFQIDLFSKPEDSLDRINFNIAALKKELNASSDEGTRLSLIQTISALQIQANTIEEQIRKIENKTGVGADLSKNTRGLLGLPDDLFTKPTKNLRGETPEEEERREKKEFEEAEKRRQEGIALDKAEKAILLKQQEDYNKAIETLYSDLGNMFSDLISGQIESQEDLFKSLLLLTLKFAEAQINIEFQTRAAIASLTALTNPIAAAKSLAQIAIGKGIVSAVFAVLRGLVQNFEEGGIIKGGLTYKRQGSKDDTLIHAKRGEMVLTEHNQSVAKKAYGENVFGVMGVKGFKQAPINNHISVLNRNADIAASMNRESMYEFADITSDAVAKAIIQQVKGNRLYDRSKLVKGLKPRRK